MAIKQYLLKIEEKTLNELKDIAEKNFRSLNKEIEFIINKYIEDVKKSSN